MNAQHTENAGTQESGRIGISNTFLLGDCGENWEHGVFEDSAAWTGTREETQAAIYFKNPTV